MSRFVSTSLASILLSSIVGCAGVAPNTWTVVATQEVARGDYCHKNIASRGSRVADYGAALSRGYHRLLWSLRRPIGQRADPATATF